MKNYNIEYRSKNKEAINAWFLANKVKVAAYKAEYAKINRDKILKYKLDNKEKIAIQQAEYGRKRSALKKAQQAAVLNEELL